MRRGGFYGGKVKYQNEEGSEDENVRRGAGSCYTRSVREVLGAGYTAIASHSCMKPGA